MFKKLIPLKPAEHKQMRLLPINQYDFARAELVAPFVIDEVVNIAHEYPIIFPAGSKLPVALMGVEKNSNAYIAANGSWLADYIPAHIRHYPFNLVAVPSNADAVNKTGKAEKAGKAAKKSVDNKAPKKPTEFIIMLDTESPFVSASEGELIFSEDGKFMTQAEEKVRILQMMQNRLHYTQSIVTAIDQAGILVDRPIRIKVSGAQDREIKGVRMIDEQALNRMDDKSFNLLRQAGALPLIYAALFSWVNFRQGPFGKSHQVPDEPAIFDDEVIKFG